MSGRSSFGAIAPEVFLQVRRSNTVTSVIRARAWSNISLPLNDPQRTCSSVRSAVHSVSTVPPTEVAAFQCPEGSMMLHSRSCHSESLSMKETQTLTYPEASGHSCALKKDSKIRSCTPSRFQTGQQIQTHSDYFNSRRPLSRSGDNLCLLPIVT